MNSSLLSTQTLKRFKERSLNWRISRQTSRKLNRYLKTTNIRRKKSRAKLESSWINLLSYLKIWRSNWQKWWLSSKTRSKTWSMSLFTMWLIKRARTRRSRKRKWVSWKTRLRMLKRKMIRWRKVIRRCWKWVLRKITISMRETMTSVKTWKSNNKSMKRR